MYDLAGAEDRRFSPFCWRARMAIAHKGLDCETRPARFTEIAEIADGKQTRVPVIDDDGRIVADSWDIAEYLEETYPDRPSLFHGEAGRHLARFVKYWAEAQVMPALVRLVVKDIHDRLEPVDQDYFRQSREQRFGQSLEDLQTDREAGRKRLGEVLTPLRLTLRNQAYLGGAAPHYADHIVFGTFQWPRVISTFEILADDDPIHDWFERCLDLYGGLGRAMSAAS
jgi:glutathione S-transferase